MLYFVRNIHIRAALVAGCLASLITGSCAAQVQSLTIGIHKDMLSEPYSGDRLLQFSTYSSLAAPLMAVQTENTKLGLPSPFHVGPNPTHSDPSPFTACPAAAGALVTESELITLDNTGWGYIIPKGGHASILLARTGCSIKATATFDFTFELDASNRSYIMISHHYTITRNNS